jgi:LysR family glycine cleavage system transcriptional activator
MHLPPLSTVRSFEATARHGSAARAAEELHVTPGAISQQLRKLEDFVGQRLFERQARGLVLTDAGRVLLAGCQEALAALQRATAQLRHQRQVLLVSCTPVFAAQWLVPRLQDFLQSAPEVDVHVSTTARLVDLAAEGVHFAVRHGLGRYAGLQARRLLDDDLQPVCSPLWVAHRPTAQAPTSPLPGCCTMASATTGSCGPGGRAPPAGHFARHCVCGFQCRHRSRAGRARRGPGAPLHGGERTGAGASAGAAGAAGGDALAYYLVFREPTLAQPAARRFHDWLLAQAALARTVDG